jgi:hypothetical protein
LELEVKVQFCKREYFVTFAFITHHKTMRMCIPSKKVFLLNYFSTKYAFQAKSITNFSLALLVPTNIVSVFTVTSGKAEMLKMAHTFEIGRTKLDLLDLINNSSIVY